MTLEILGEQEYQDYLDTLESYSTFQTTQMAALLQKGAMRRLTLACV